MGKTATCTPATREAILELRKLNLSYKQISDRLNCSKKKVFNALKHFEMHNTCENVPRKTRPRKTSVRDDRKIIRLSKADPKKSARVIQREVCDEIDSPVSVWTIRRRLVEAGLHGRVARKKPMVTKRQRQKRLEFARHHLSYPKEQWKFILWSDETKINRIGPDGRRFVRRPKRREFDPKYTSAVVKHGGGSINVWGCFSWNGVGPIHRIDGILTKEKYVDILRDVMLPWAEENLPVIWKFQQDNDPKHTAKYTKKFFEDNSINVLDWASSSADLNPIEHLWGDVKNSISALKISNMDALFEEVKKSWFSIPVERCRALISSMPNRCKAVLMQKGFPTKY